MLLLSLASSLLLQGALGPELRQDGYGFRPPEGFYLVRMERQANTRLGAVALESAAERRLSAALMDGEGTRAATLLVALVDEAFSASPSERDGFGAAVLQHFSGELGLPLTPQRVERWEGQVPRVEVLGTLRQEGQVRTVLVAGLASPGRQHAVITVSAPAERWQELEPQVRASLETFRMEPPAASRFSRGLSGAVAGALAGALVASYAAWRRRNRQARGA